MTDTPVTLVGSRRYLDADIFAESKRAELEAERIAAHLASVERKEK